MSSFYTPQGNVIVDTLAELFILDLLLYRLTKNLLGCPIARS